MSEDELMVMHVDLDGFEVDYEVIGTGEQVAFVHRATVRELVLATRRAPVFVLRLALPPDAAERTPTVRYQ